MHYVNQSVENISESFPSWKYSTTAWNVYDEKWCDSFLDCNDEYLMHVHKEMITYRAEWVKDKVISMKKTVWQNMSWSLVIFLSEYSYLDERNDKVQGTKALFCEKSVCCWCPIDKWLTNKSMLFTIKLKLLQYEISIYLAYIQFFVQTVNSNQGWIQDFGIRVLVCYGGLIWSLYEIFQIPHENKTLWTWRGSCKPQQWHQETQSKLVFNTILVLAWIVLLYYNQ